MSGKDIKLTGEQVKKIREHLGESQKAFAERIAVTQPVIHRLEKKSDVEMTGPEIILIHQIGKQNGVSLSS